MSFTDQIVKATQGVPKIAVGILLGVLALGIFVMGFDQGQLFALAQGNPADSANPAYRRDVDARVHARHEARRWIRMPLGATR